MAAREPVQFEDSVVKITSQRLGLLGSGFFVAPRVVLTCLHVIDHIDPTELRCEWQSYCVAFDYVVAQDVLLDVALLRVNLSHHPVPEIDASWSRGDQVYSFGYSSRKPRGEGVTAECEALAMDDRTLLKIKNGQVRDGMSGAPVLNNRTESIFAIMTRTRNKDTALGGLVLPLDFASDFLRDSIGLIVNSSLSLDGAPGDQRVDQSPPLDTNLIPRSAALEEIQGLLLRPRRGPRVFAVASIQGLGGIGKTSLATMIAHDERVKRHFADGTLWAHLGQAAEVAQWQGIWLDAFGQRSQATSVDVLSTQLRQVLRNKQCLLVIDDVWSVNDLRPFLVGGSECAVLFTTRREEIAFEIGAILSRLSHMTDAEARLVLERRIGHRLRGAEMQFALRAMAAVENLPLAVEQIGSLVARGLRWSDLIRKLEKEAERLDALQTPADRLKGATSRVEAVLRVSTEALRRESSIAWERYLRLGLLAPDAQLSAASCASLWDCSRGEAEDVLSTLSADSLLISAELSPVTRESRTRQYRLHDLFRDLVQKTLVQAKPLGLGLDLSAEHRHYLGRCRRRGKALRPWSRMSDDGYIIDHLVWHLARARMGKELMSLFKSRSWYQLRSPRRNPRSFLRDIEQAWAALESPDCNLADVDEAIAPLRLALCRSSVHSLSYSLPAALIPELSKRELLSVEAGLWYAEALEDACTRYRTQIMLSAQLAEGAAQRLLRETLMIITGKGRGLGELVAPCLYAMLDRGFWELALEAITLGGGFISSQEAIDAIAAPWPAAHVERLVSTLESLPSSVGPSALVEFLRFGHHKAEVEARVVRAIAKTNSIAQRCRLRIKAQPYLRDRQVANSAANALFRDLGELPEGRATSLLVGRAVAVLPNKFAADIVQRTARRISAVDAATMYSTIEHFPVDAAVASLAISAALRQACDMGEVVLRQLVHDCLPRFGNNLELVRAWIDCVRKTEDAAVLERLLARGACYLPSTYVRFAVGLLFLRLAGTDSLAEVLSTWLASENEPLIREAEKFLSEKIVELGATDSGIAKLAVSFALRVVQADDPYALGLCELIAQDVNGPIASFELMGAFARILPKKDAQMFAERLRDAVADLLAERSAEAYAALARGYRVLTRRERMKLLEDLLELGDTDLQGQLLGEIAQWLPDDLLRRYLNDRQLIDDRQELAALLARVNAPDDEEDSERADAWRRAKILRSGRQQLEGLNNFDYACELFQRSVETHDVAVSKSLVRHFGRYCDTSVAANVAINMLLWDAEYGARVLEQVIPYLSTSMGQYMGDVLSWMFVRGPLRKMSHDAHHVAFNVASALPLVRFLSESGRDVVVERAAKIVSDKRTDVWLRCWLSGLLYRFTGILAPADLLAAAKLYPDGTTRADRKESSSVREVVFACAPLMSTDERNAFVRMAREAASPPKLRGVLLSFSPAVGIELVHEAVTELSPAERVTVLTRWVDLYDGELRGAVLKMIDEEVRRVGDSARSIEVLLDAALVGDEQKARSYAVKALARTIEDNGSSISSPLQTTMLFGLLPAERLREAWRAWLYRISRGARPDVLEQLTGGYVFAAFTGGGTLVKAVAREADAASKLWP